MKNILILFIAVFVFSSSGCTYVQETQRLKGEQAYWTGELAREQDLARNQEIMLDDLKARLSVKQSRYNRVSTELTAIRRKVASTRGNQQEVKNLEKELARLEAEIKDLKKRIILLS